MKLFGMGMPEFLIILAVVLLIFGPKNLPKLGSALGKTVKNLRDGMGTSTQTETEESVLIEEAAGEDESAPVKTTVKASRKKPVAEAVQN